MKFTPTEIPDVILVRPDVYRDERGFFLETFHDEKYAKGGICGPFIQDNQAKSTKGVLRGLHAQRKHTQGKLVRVIEGKIFDVAVDARQGSPWFGKWIGCNLTAESFEQLFIPAGFLHGYCVLSDVAQIEYKCTDLYDPSSEITVAWDDPEIGIEWPLTDPILSGKDAAGRRMGEQMENLFQYAG